MKLTHKLIALVVVMLTISLVVLGSIAHYSISETKEEATEQSVKTLQEREKDELVKTSKDKADLINQYIDKTKAVTETAMHNSVNMERSGMYREQVLGNYQDHVNGYVVGEYQGYFNGGIYGVIEGDMDAEIGKDIFRTSGFSGKETSIENIFFKGNIDGNVDITVEVPKGVYFNGTINGNDFIYTDTSEHLSGNIVGEVYGHHQRKDAGIKLNGSIQAYIDGSIAGAVDSNINGTIDIQCNGSLNGDLDGYVDLLPSWYEDMFEVEMKTHPSFASFYMGKSRFWRFQSVKRSQYITTLNGYNCTKRGWYREAVRKKETIVTSPYVDATGEGLMVTVSSPGYQDAEKEELSSVISADVTIQSLAENVMEIGKYETGYAFMINKTGHLIAIKGLNESYEHWSEAIETENYLETNNTEFRSIVESMTNLETGIHSINVSVCERYNETHEGYMYGPTTTKGDKIIAYAPINTTGWSIGIVVSVEEVASPSQEVGRTIKKGAEKIIRMFILAAIGVIIAGVVSSAILGFEYVKPLRDLTEGVKRLGKGDLDVEFKGEEKKDEVGELARTFNTMTQKLKESRTMFKNLFESNPDPVLLLDEEGKGLMINEAVTTKIGYSKEEIEGVFVEDLPFLPDDSKGKALEKLEKGLKGSLIGPFQLHLRSKKGDKLVFEINTTLLERDDKIMGVIVVGRDITKRWESEKALRESESRFKALAEGSPFPLFVYRDKFVFVNPASEELTGYSSDELQDMHFWEVVHLDHREMVKERGLKRIKGGRGLPTSYEFKISTKEGKERWVYFTGILINYQGEPAGLGTAIDITERKETEKELKEYKNDLEDLVDKRTAELEEANKQLKSFAYSVSHDLRAPLRSMQGFSRALLEDYAEELGEEGRDFAERIVESAEKMDRLILDLLKYSRLTRQEIKIEKVDLNNVFDDSISNVKEMIERKEAKIELEEDLPQVMGQKRVLVQVFSNLIHNAVKYSKPDEKPKINISSRVEDEKVKISVEDNGIGIDLEYQDKIFDMFERLHSEEKYPGTGVGLSIVKKAIDRLNGKVSLESEPGKGSTFWIELPKAGN